jgi:hypothetical protein
MFQIFDFSIFKKAAAAATVWRSIEKEVAST